MKKQVELKNSDSARAEALKNINELFEREKLKKESERILAERDAQLERENAEAERILAEEEARKAAEPTLHEQDLNRTIDAPTFEHRLNAEEEDAKMAKIDRRRAERDAELERERAEQERLEKERQRKEEAQRKRREKEETDRRDAEAYSKRMSENQRKASERRKQELENESFFDRISRLAREKADNLSQDAARAVGKVKDTASDVYDGIKDELGKNVGRAVDKEKDVYDDAREEEGGFVDRVQDKLKEKIGERKYGIYEENFKKLLAGAKLNPTGQIRDALLFYADKLGLPSSVTYYLRDLNSSAPYRSISAIEAIYDTMKDIKSGKGFHLNENYKKRLGEDSILKQLFVPQPLTTTESSYSDDELKALKSFQKRDGSITTESIRQKEGTYADSDGGIIDHLTKPEKIAEVSIGAASPINGNKDNIGDVYDFNVKSEHAKRVNKNYENRIKRFLKDPLNPENKIGAYAPFRYAATIINSTDEMPDKYKIRSDIDLSKVKP